MKSSSGILVVIVALLNVVAFAEPSGLSDGQRKAMEEWKAWMRKAGERETNLVHELHQKITAAAVKREADMILYTNQVQVIDRNQRRYTLHDATNELNVVMVPIKGGEFMMGSSRNEAGHRDDEAPLHRVRISPFWMQDTEVTWEQYEPFMLNVEKENSSWIPTIREPSDAVAKPTKPYLEYSFGMGKVDRPALAMTQHAANKFCEWLSAKTGHFYRLPTEAEWEYACRAGSTNAYSFGDDVAKLDQYAWYAENSDEKYHPIRKKKPNAWGLYDMHGNVAEWCLDQYDPEFYLRGKDTVMIDPWNKATKPYPHVVRGGAWGEEMGSPEDLRSAARAKSRREWKTDPNLPPSIWYADSSKCVGFRIVRPLKVPTEQEMYQYWNSGVENDDPRYPAQY